MIVALCMRKAECSTDINADQGTRCVHVVLYYCGICCGTQWTLQLVSNE